MSDKMRKEFEEWVHYRQYLKRNKDGSYNEEWVDARWVGWQASRAALVVELPSALTAPPYASYEGGWNDMREEAQDAIHATGVTTK